MNHRISSLQNPRIKQAVHLRKGVERKKENLTIVEGFREVQLAVSGGFKTHTIFVSPSLTGEEKYARIRKILPGHPLYEVPRKVYSRIACREGSDGVLALMVPKRLQLDQVELSENPLVLVAESVEKPGNIGAMLRTADAAGVDAVIVCDPGTDIYNPNIIRSSLGSVFTSNVVACTTGEALDWLKERGIRVAVTALNASRPYHETDFKLPLALVVGAEDRGVSEIWIERSDENIIIPMFGKVDSMNVSVSAAVVLFEALRQRGFKKR